MNASRRSVGAFCTCSGAAVLMDGHSSWVSIPLMMKDGTPPDYRPS